MTVTDRDAWLEWRRGGVGGSDVAGILGISPWSSPFSIWLDKLGLLPDEPENEAMSAGRWLEAAIGPWFTHETGLVVLGAQTWATHAEVDHHRCTPDGYAFAEDPDTLANLPHVSRDYDIPEADLVAALVAQLALGSVQIKVTGPGRKPDHLDEHHQAQGQWEMHVTGLDRCWFAVLRGRRLDVHLLERDQADIDFMVGRVDEFWERHVLEQSPPEVDGSDATSRALAVLYPPAAGDGPGEVVRHARGSQVDRLVAEWKAAKEAAKEAKAEAEYRGNLVKAQLGDCTELVIGSDLAASWRPQTTRRLDTKALAAIDPTLARRYTRETRSRVLRAHKPKETP